MKTLERFIGLLAYAMAFSAQATTLNPVQLLNPAGSTSGQAIVSTGSSSAPGWANVAVANVTGAAPIASPTFTGTVTIPSGASIAGYLTTASAASTYAPLNGPTFTGNVTINTGGTNPIFAITNSGGTTIDIVNNSSNSTYGFFNNTSGHQTLVFNSSTDIGTFFARPIFGSATPWDSANLNFTTPPAIGGTTPAAGAFTTLSSTGNFTPSQTNGIVGTTTSNNANAGSVGEYVTATGTAVSLTTATLTNVISISLTAGDWDVTGAFAFNPAGTTVMQAQDAGISTTSATLPAAPLFFFDNSTKAASASDGAAVPSQRLILASTTTVYLVAYASFTTSTCTVTGTISARRRR